MYVAFVCVIDDCRGGSLTSCIYHECFCTVDDKSKVLDIDNPDVDLFPEFHKATRYECVLSPGDILFIPG